MQDTSRSSRVQQSPAPKRPPYEQGLTTSVLTPVLRVQLMSLAGDSDNPYLTVTLIAAVVAGA